MLSIDDVDCIIESMLSVLLRVPLSSSCLFSLVEGPRGVAGLFILSDELMQDLASTLSPQRVGILQR